MTRTAIFLVLGGAMAAMEGTSVAQRSPSWRVYRMADGLPDSGCFAVAASGQGKILVRHFHIPAITELDGYELKILSAPDRAPGGRVYGSPGGQLWSASYDGLLEFKDGAWLFHPVPQIAARYTNISLRLPDSVPLCPVRQGRVLFLLPEGLFEFNAEEGAPPETRLLIGPSRLGVGSFTGMAAAHAGGLWVLAEHGLARTQEPVKNLKPDSDWSQFLLPDALEARTIPGPVENADGSITCIAESATNHSRMVLRFNGRTWTAQSSPGDKASLAWESSDGVSWVVAGGTLFESDGHDSAPVPSREISASTCHDVAVESDGSFWLATSAGLFRYSPPLWRPPAQFREATASIRSLAGDNSGRVWLVTGEDLKCIYDEKCKSYRLPVLSEALSEPIELYPVKSGVLLASKDRILWFRADTERFSEADLGKLHPHPLGLLRDGNLCIQTRASGQTNFVLQAFNGESVRPFLFPAPDPDLGENLSACLETHSGDLWLAGDHATACCHDSKWRSFVSTNNTAPESGICFCELPDGKIWCATRERVWEFDGRNWSEVRRGFDRINNMVRARDGSVWVAAGSGLYRFFRDAWVENGPEEGLPGSDALAVIEDSQARVWAATVRGLVLYHPEADVDPPKTFLQELSDVQKKIPEGGAIAITFHGQDKWKSTPSSRLLFSHRLDERDWSAFDDPDHVTFSDLPPGKHYFLVRAMDRNCNVDPNPARLEFAVELPWFKEGRLVLITAAGAGIALFLGGLALNRHRQLVKSYAQVEKRVAQRSRELELANRQLLHSQKMNALGALSAGIAHDFNNILSIIKGSVQIIETSLDDTQKIRTRVDRIKTVVEQGSGIVKAMLGFSRESDQKPAAWDLNPIVEDTIRLLGDRFLHETQVRFTPAADLPQVICVREFTQQILLNFVFNASDAMEKHKQIIVSTLRLDRLPAGLILPPSPVLADETAGSALPELPPHPSPLPLRGGEREASVATVHGPDARQTDLVAGHEPSPATTQRSPAHYVAVSVRDFGSGIAPEILPRIFEPFFTTKALSSRRGAGLGLSMVYELAKRMGAGLAVETTVGTGSTFTLILPVNEPSPTRAS